MLDLLALDFLPALLMVIPFLAVGLVSTSNGELIRQVSILEGVKRIKMPEGRYAGVELEVNADNKSGESVTADDLGRARVLRNGDDQHATFATFDRLFQLYDEFTHDGPTRDATDGGTSTLRAQITNALPKILPANALHVPSDEQTTLVLDFDSAPGGSSGLNALANSGSCKIVGYKNPAIAEEKSVRVEKTTKQFSGAGTDEVQNILGPNVVMVYVSDPDGVVTDLDLTRKMPGGISDEDVWDDAPIDRVQRRYEQMDRDYGSSTLYGVFVPATPAAQEIKNRGVDLELTVSGATNNLEVTYIRVAEPVPSGSVAGAKQRARKLSNA
jgi:hypothetical protein